MPSSNLFAVNNQGRVFALQTDQAVWDELPYLGIDFKRVSAHDTVVWALGGDHQIYVYVYGTSVPIRVCEEAYENQRWNPVEGFTNNLLPSDRPSFSSIDGLENRSLQSIHLPSLAWNWEGPWHLQDTFEGKALDKECWTYAVDFPRHFTAEKTWMSCVRRRKWVRYRRYIALDTWSAVASIHKDHTQEPFIDIAVGGGDVIGEDPDRLMVWSVTAFGKVAVREGICATCPEGTRWAFVPTPPKQDVTSLSVGRSGRVWALSWDGSALVRTGVSRDCPLGLNWVVVDPPAPDSSLKQIAVGNSVVWGVCRDATVWFRRGLDEAESGYHDNRKRCADTSGLGTSWLQMMGSLSMLSVGPNNQVWGITCDDSSLVARTGVTSSEETGKTWKAIRLPLRHFDPNRENEDPFESPNSSCDDSATCSKKGSRAPSLVVPLGDDSPTSLAPDTESPDAVSMMTEPPESEGSQGGDGPPSSKEPSETGAAPSPFTKDRSPPIAIGGEGPPSSDALPPSSEFSNLRLRYPDDMPDSMTSSVISNTVANFIGSNYPYEDCPPPPFLIQGTSADDTDVEAQTGSSVSSGGEQQSQNGEGYPGLEALSRPPLSPYFLLEPRLRHLGRCSLASSMSSLSNESFIPGQGGEPPREERPLLTLALPGEDVWMWVSGSGCWVQPPNMPKWFVSADSASMNSEEPWRGEIIDRLQQRRQREVSHFKGYPEAVECSSWVVTGQCRYLAGNQWVPGTLELHMVGSSRGACRLQEAFLKIIYTLGSKKTALISCCSIVLVSLTVDLPAKAFLTLYTPKQPLRPALLLFSAEKDAEQWLNHVSSACVQFRGMGECPSTGAIWAVSAHGFIYFHDTEATERELKVESEAAHSSLDVGEGTTPALFPLERGFRPGCFVTIIGKVHESAKRFNVDLMLDESSMNIAFHLNPRFNEKVVVMNTREHNAWGYEQRESVRPFSRGKEVEVTLLCDDRDIKVSVNGRLFFCFEHRVMPWSITHLHVDGDITLKEIVYNCGAGDRTPQECFWRGVGGHLRVVEAGAGGVTWGLSYDAHVYTYTGVCGGGVYKGNANDSQVRVMSDTRHFYVWENQRWNPLTGFTHRGLPTDRKTWSDESGRHEKTKDGTKLPSRHWQWIGDWTVDHHTPPGVDKDGWQYATDFPMSYHGHRYVTDLVRRRRWVRKCRISTSGPWRQMEKVALISVSVSPEAAEEGTIPVWGVSASHEVVMREGVTPQRPRGTRWALISSETPMKEICAGVMGGVWAVSCSGQAHLRIGVTKTNPKGYDWVNVDAPHVPLREVGTGNWTVWTVDRDGNLYLRVNVQPLFPEGTAWERICGGVESISVGVDGSLGAVLKSCPSEDPPTGAPAGVIAMRKGISKDNPGGTGWDIFSGTGWSHISTRIPLLN